VQRNALTLANRLGELRVRELMAAATSQGWKSWPRPADSLSSGRIGCDIPDSVTTIHVVGAALFRDQRCLVAQRSASMLLPGKWEFPGGKVEPGEAPEAALAREIHEELGLHVQVGPFLARGTASAKDQRPIALDVYAAHIVTGTLVLREHAQVQWASADELSGFDWAEADIPIFPAVRAHLLALAR
jgi:8-oxo-dGTP diphosphatase